jgi:hypothetical protein
LYLELIKENNLKAIYNFLTNKNEILLSEIMEIARDPLPKLDEVIQGLIDYLKNSPAHNKLLIDVLFIKGGMEEIKKFAYTNGAKHPPVFLYYYQYAKDQGFSEFDLLQLILDGIKIIPEKYQTRTFLSLDLIEMAKKTNDKNNLIFGYSTTFYSAPTLRNLTYFLGLIISEKNEKEANKLKKYLSQRDIKKSNSSNFSYYKNHTLSEDIYSLDSLKIDCKTLIIGRYIFEGIEPLLDFINPKDYLGFSGPLRYIAIIISLALKSISQSHDAHVIDRLIEHYCLDETREEHIILKKLISNKANSLPNPQNYLLKLLKKVEKLSVKRVSHILENKLRGGYESACLLLVACAEAKQILVRDGDRFIHQIDTQYKRFSAFRKSLKDLTSMSKYLISFR